MKKSWKTRGAGAALIILLTGLAYIPAVRDGFVFDDATLISENRIVQAPDGLYRFWFTREPNDYYPLTWSLWWLEWRLWGNRPTGYHVVNRSWLGGSKPGCNSIAADAFTASLST